MTKVAWHLKRDEIQNSQPNETKKKFVYNISRSGYRKEWGHIYEKPGVYARTQALFLRVVPKIGPFSGLAFHPPTPAVEQLYMNSFNDALDHYRALLLAQQEHRLQLPNENLDTGAATGAAKYRLADQTYAKLLRETSGKPISDALRRDILSFYADLEEPFATKRNSKAWQELIRELDTLKSTPAVGISHSTESNRWTAFVPQELRREPIKPDGTELDLVSIDGIRSCE